MPKRLRRSRRRGASLPRGTKYVGRPTKWGNPFAVGIGAQTPLLTRDKVVQMYARWLAGLYPEVSRKPPSVGAIRSELRGRDLACWCPLACRCHADVLLKVANSDGPLETVLKEYLDDPCERTLARSSAVDG